MSWAFTVRMLVLATILIIPLRIVGQGFLPPDDALRHAAKVVSGRPWTEIVVLRPDMTLDAHPGWHAFLRGVRQLTGADAHALVLVSVVGLFVLALLPAPLLLRRPEAALTVLTVLVVAEHARLALGADTTAGALALEFQPTNGVPRVFYSTDMSLLFRTF